MDFINKHSKLFQWLLLLLTFFGLIFAIDIPEGYKFIRAEAEHIVVEGRGGMYIKKIWTEVKCLQWGAMPRARKKKVAISQSGRMARNNALAAVAPVLNEVVSDLGKDHFKQALPILRGLRVKLEQ